jgi:hypothetical protein
MSNSNNMSATVDFSKLNLPIPTNVLSLSKEKQQEIYNYLLQLDATQQKAYSIAQNHLGTSFNIFKSNGYKEWKQKQK